MKKFLLLIINVPLKVLHFRKGHVFFGLAEKENPESKYIEWKRSRSRKLGTHCARLKYPRFPGYFEPPSKSIPRFLIFFEFPTFFTFSISGSMDYARLSKHSAIIPGNPGRQGIDGHFHPRRRGFFPFARGHVPQVGIFVIGGDGKIELQSKKRRIGRP